MSGTPRMDAALGDPNDNWENKAHRIYIAGCDLECELAALRAQLDSQRRAFVRPDDIRAQLEAVQADNANLRTTVENAVRAITQIKDISNVNQYTRQLLVQVGNSLNSAIRKGTP